MPDEIVHLPDGQAALFDDPQRLLLLDLPELRLLGFELARQAKPMLAQLRRTVGLMAWAMRHRLDDGEYGSWCDDYAEMLGMHERTLRRWRDEAVAAQGLTLPVTTRYRRDSAREVPPAPASGNSSPPTPSPAPLPAPEPPRAPVPPAPEPDNTVPEDDARIPEAFRAGQDLRLPTHPNVADIAAVVSWLAARPLDHLARLPDSRQNALIALARELHRRRADHEPPPLAGPCPHPKKAEEKLPYMTRCKACGERIR